MQLNQLPAAYVALADICFKKQGEWLPLGEETYAEQGLSSTLSLVEPQTSGSMRAVIGALRAGTYRFKGRELNREQLMSELEGEPVAFHAQVEWDAAAQAWTVQKRD
ncbi:hypothetical protein [Hymenobacter guriensis]|uniref:Uncharacterized protein n=1 Tax=Hymenobacter guriensis TaxID=2793065 RepID=A0ABS0L4L3_9BACT|nr:hypothetical protein [Hymenobacter guriensis]MBG8555061.1 hypothetical protein [Hymenobacter guriensis]